MTFRLANEHLHVLVDMLYCHFMNMKHVLCILCNTIMLWIFMCAHCYRKRRCESTVVVSAGAEKHAEGGLLC